MGGGHHDSYHPPNHHTFKGALLLVLARAALAVLAWHPSPLASPCSAPPTPANADVWSPTGGWWCDPKGWRRNTAFALG